MNPELSAEKWTDKELARLEKRIDAQYKQAEKELTEKAQDYFEKYGARWQKEHLAMLTSMEDKETIKEKWVNLYGSEKGFESWYKTADHAYGKTAIQAKKKFQRWETAQLGRGQHWIDMRDQMAQRIAETAQIAEGYINDVLPGIYVANSNGVARLGMQAATEQGILGVKFDLVDEYTVRRLMVSSSEVRPYKKVVISMDETTKYSKNKLQNALLQGILQGDDIYDIATRFERAVGMSRNVAIRNARTAVTGARNAGKQDRYHDLANKGCEITKVWNDTHDAMPPEREDHWGASGQEVPYDEPFEVGGEELMFPGDPDGSPWNICNCRCAMHTGTIKFHSVLSDEARRKANIRVK